MNDFKISIMSSILCLFGLTLNTAAAQSMIILLSNG